MFFVITKNKCMIIGLIFLLSGVLGGVGIKNILSKNAQTYNGERNLKILIDAGHGKPDGGTVGVSGSVESDLNLDIAQKLSQILEGKGITTQLTRNSKDGLRNKDGKWSKIDDMNQRLKMMKNSDANLFISIHMNHFEQENVNGLKLFYAKNHEEIKPLGKLMEEKMSGVTGAKINPITAIDRNLFLMKSPPIPAILIECGFLSNPEEEKKLSNEEYRAKIAWAIAESIEEYFVINKQQNKIL